MMELNLTVSGAHLALVKFSHPWTILVSRGISMMDLSLTVSGARLALVKY